MSNANEKLNEKLALLKAIKMDLAEILTKEDLTKGLATARSLFQGWKLEPVKDTVKDGASWLVKAHNWTVRLPARLDGARTLRCSRR